MRLEAQFTGRVQGVGFRYTTLRIALRYDVVGYVRNLPDGAVQVVVEGEQGLHEFLDEVENVMGSKVHDRQRRESDATGEFDAFEIRY